MGGYAAPAYPGGAAPMGINDPLVLPAGASYSQWLAKVQEVAKRSWKSALIIAGVGIAVPQAAVSLISNVAGWGAGFSLLNFGSLTAAIGSLFLGLLISLVASIAGCWVAAAGWAGGVFALVHEANGQKVSVGQAFGYGFKRATALFPWTVLAGAMFTIGRSCLFVPGVYFAYACAFFGFVAIFERGQNPIGRSFGLTHNGTTIGATLGRVGTLFGVYFLYTFIVGLIFGAIGLAVAVGIGGRGGVGAFGYDLGFGIFQAIAALLSAPALAVLLIGLLPTYAELRNRETPISSPQLQQQLG